MLRSLGMIISFVAVSLFLLSLLIFWFLTSGQVNLTKGADQFAECRTSNAFGGSTIGGEFELVNQDGLTVTDKDIFK